MTLLRRSHCFAEKHSDVAATSAVEAFAVFAAARSRIWSGDDTDVVSRVNRAGDYVLSPGHAHVARYSRDTIGPVNDEIMAFGFAGDRLSDRRIEKTIPFRGAEWGAQIGCVFVPQTHVKPASACHSHPIAGRAKIVSQRRDEANQAAGLPDSHVPRRSTGAIVGLLQTETPSELRAHFHQRQVLIDA